MLEVDVQLLVSNHTENALVSPRGQKVLRTIKMVRRPNASTKLVLDLLNNCLSIGGDALESTKVSRRPKCIKRDVDQYACELVRARSARPGG